MRGAQAEARRPTGSGCAPARLPAPPRRTAALPRGRHRLAAGPPPPGARPGCGGERGGGGRRGGDGRAGAAPLRSAPHRCCRSPSLWERRGAARRGGAGAEGAVARPGRPPPSASGSAERVCPCACASRRYFTVAIGTGRGEAMAARPHPRPAPPLPVPSMPAQALNQLMEPQRSPHRAGGRGGSGAALAPAPSSPLRAAPAPSWRGGPGCLLPGGSGPRGAGPRGAAAADVPRFPPRPRQGERRERRSGHRPAPPGDTRGRRKGERGNSSHRSPRARPARRRLFTAPYGCRGRGEGDVCRLPNRCAHYVRWSHGHRACRQHPAPGRRGGLCGDTHTHGAARRPRCRHTQPLGYSGGGRKRSALRGTV